MAQEIDTASGGSRSEPDQAAYMDQFIVNFREQHCRRDESGGWLCSACRVALLTEQDTIQCAPCVADAERQRAQNEARRRMEQEQACQHNRREAVVAQVPSWPHVKGVSTTKERTDPRLWPFVQEFDLSASGLVLGPSRSGKTSASACIVHRAGTERLEALQKRPRDPSAIKAFNSFTGLRWLSAWDLARAQSAHRLGTGEESKLITEAVQASFLFLDEAGPEPAHVAGLLFDVVYRRGVGGLHTLVTSGLTAEQFKGRYGSGLFCRLTERGIGMLIDLHPRRGS